MDTRKRKNSAPLPNFGKKVSNQHVDQSTLSQSNVVPSSQPVMHDRGYKNKMAGHKQSRDLNQVGPGSTCPECNLNVSNEDDYIFSCTVCKNVYHGKCLEFDESSLDLIKAVFESISWTCRSCQTNAKSALLKVKDKTNTQAQKSSKLDQTQLDKLSALEKEIDLLRARISSLESLISTESSAGTSQSSEINTDTAAPAQSNDHKHSTEQLKINEIKSSVMKAVHTDLLNKKNRQRNLIISGLKQSSTIADKDLFKDLYASHFDIRPIPDPIFCRRLTPKDHNKHNNRSTRIDPLLVVLPTEAQAQYILTNARSLRESDRDHIRDNVYINRDLTKAEAAAEYEQRQRRRQKAKQSHVTKPMQAGSLNPTNAAASQYVFNLSTANGGVNPIVPDVSSRSSFPPLVPQQPSSSQASFNLDPSTIKPNPPSSPQPSTSGQSKLNSGNK